MTLFDYAAGLLLLVSSVIGLMRGATREITTVVALVLATVIAVFVLRFTGPIARHGIHAVWLANTVALLLIFILAYLGLRLIGGVLTRSVQATALSGLDRGLGFGIGLVRALVVLGGVTLLLNAATAPERIPKWISGAALFPLATAAGEALRTFAPQGLKMAHEVAPVLEDAVSSDAASPDGTATRRDHHSGESKPSSAHRTSDSPEEESR